MSAIAEKALTEEQRAQFQREGYLIVRALFTQEEVAAIRAAFMELNAEGPVPGLSEINPNYKPSDPLSFYPRMMHPHLHPEYAVGDLSMRYMLDKRVEAILTELFGEEAVAAQSMFYFKPPGARGQDFHQDNYYLRVKPGTCIAAWTAVDDADLENGGMALAPGSHTLEVFCPGRADNAQFFTTDHVDIPENMEAVPAIMKAGDVLFFNGSVIHGSYPNTSADRFRCAFICHYVPRASQEVSQGYRPLYDFNGVIADDEIGAATGGGPCGTPEPSSPH